MTEGSPRTVSWVGSGHRQTENVYRKTPISPQMTRITQPRRRAPRRLLGTMTRTRRPLRNLRQSRDTMLVEMRKRGESIGGRERRLGVSERAIRTSQSYSINRHKINFVLLTRQALILSYCPPLAHVAVSPPMKSSNRYLAHGYPNTRQKELENILSAITLLPHRALSLIVTIHQ